MAIVTQSAKVSAHVAAFGRVKESQYNPGQTIQSIKFVSSDGTQEHWATFPREDARAFTMQQPVYLIPTQRKGKSTFDIEPLDQPAQRSPMGFQASPPAVAPAMQQPPLGTDHAGESEAEQKRAIAAWVTGQAKLLRYCREQVVATEPGLSPSEVQASAATLYISTCRKFGLER